MQNPSPGAPKPEVSSYPLLTALRERRSRRFGRGMKMPTGPLAFESRQPVTPLTEDEEALMAFAACGITGHALAELCYAPGGGGTIMGGLVARTIASGDGLQTVSLVVTNDEGTWLVRRPQELPPTDIPTLIELGRQGQFTELYRKCRVKIKDGRTKTPLEPIFNINANSWSAHVPGTTYFLPLNGLTLMYVNGLLEIFNEFTGLYLLDERNDFRPAGLAEFAKSNGGHLDDDPSHGRVATVRQLEQFVTEFVTIEQGMMLQNLGLMAQALGLGGFPNFANHEFAWPQALGFKMEQMPASQYLGAGKLASLGMKLLKKNPLVPFPVSLEKDGEVLLKSLSPPCYKTMTDAVQAVVDKKFGPNGIFRAHRAGNAWENADQITRQIPPLTNAAIAATTAYCEYLYGRYGRFPVYLTPFRTIVGFQACHLDEEFYSRFYRAEALGESQRADCKRQSSGK